MAIKLLTAFVESMKEFRLPPRIFGAKRDKQRPKVVLFRKHLNAVSG
jgi:hypothetical protein